MFKRLLAALIEGRQKKANYEIAKMIRMYEFPKETVEYVIANMEKSLEKSSK